LRLVQRGQFGRWDPAGTVLNSTGAVLVAVAGANNAGVSAVVETFGPRGGPPAVVRVPDTRAEEPA
jgi:hypothetical protein